MTRVYAGRRSKSATAVVLALVTGCVVTMAGVQSAGAASTEVSKDESPDLAITQLAAAESTLTVAPGAGTVAAATVTVAATHTRVGDLIVRLTHVASGTTVTLLDQPGVVGIGNGDNSNLLQAHPISFQDGPGLPDPETMGGGGGMGNNAVVCRDDGVCLYRSHEALGALAGLPASGDWRLSIMDARAQDDGQLGGWTLRLDTEPEVTTTVPGAPTIGTAVAGDGGATLSWTAPESDGGSAIVGYVVTPYVGPDPSASVSFASTATTQTVAGLINGTAYRFEVAAINLVGTGPASTPSNEVVPILMTVPGAPTIGSAAAGDGVATVSWTAPVSDGGSPVSGYVVTPYIGYYPLPPQMFSSTDTTQVVTGLTNGTQYRFRVQAVNAVGTGGYSTVTNLVTPAPATVPGAPVIGAAVAGDGEAVVSWTAPAADGGSAVTAYLVTSYIGYYPLAPQMFSSTDTTQVVTGLANGTEYRFRVQAINAVGTGGFSKVTNPVTPSA